MDCSINNPRLDNQMKVTLLKAVGHKRLGIEGMEGGASSWLVLDYGDVIVHVFLAEIRHFYEIERLTFLRAVHSKRQLVEVLADRRAERVVADDDDRDRGHDESDPAHGERDCSPLRPSVRGAGRYLLDRSPTARRYSSTGKSGRSFLTVSSQAGELRSNPSPTPAIWLSPASW